MAALTVSSEADDRVLIYALNFTVEPCRAVWHAPFLVNKYTADQLAYFTYSNAKILPKRLWKRYMDI